MNSSHCIFRAALAMALIGWGPARGLAQEAWFELASASYPTTLSDATFGYSVALSGEWLFVGAPTLDSINAPGFENRGGVFVYRIVGSQLQQVTILRPDSLTRGESGNFGWSISATANAVAIGAPNDYASDGAPRGAAYLFDWDGTQWTRRDRVGPVPVPSVVTNRFGVTVCLTPSDLFVTAANAPIPLRGGSAVFAYARGTSNLTYVSRIIPDDFSVNSDFGAALAARDDTLIVGAPTDDHGGQQAGAAYVFNRGSGDWLTHQRLIVPDIAESDYVGWSVALCNGRALIGAPGDIVNGLVSGSVHVFQDGPQGWARVQRLISASPIDGQGFGARIACADDLIAFASQHWVDAFGSRVQVVGDAAVIPPPSTVFPLAGLSEQGFAAAIAVDANRIAVTKRSYSGAEPHRVYIFARSADCNANQIPDVLEVVDNPAIDCDANGIPDTCDFATDTSRDCDGDSRLDMCAVAAGDVSDCNGNGRPDSCDLADGAADFNGNAIPDTCECIGDVTGDNRIGLDDLALLLRNFGMPVGARLEEGDLDNDDAVTLQDLAMLLSRFGTLCQ